MIHIKIRLGSIGKATQPEYFCAVVRNEEVNRKAEKQSLVLVLVPLTLTVLTQDKIEEQEARGSLWLLIFARKRQFCNVNITDPASRASVGIRTLPHYARSKQSFIVFAVPVPLLGAAGRNNKQICLIKR